MRGVSDPSEMMNEVSGVHLQPCKDLCSVSYKSTASVMGCVNLTLNIWFIRHLLRLHTQ